MIPENQTDFANLLSVLCQAFPFKFTVEKGGVEARLHITDTERVLIVRPDGTWKYN